MARSMKKMAGINRIARSSTNYFPPPVRMVEIPSIIVSEIGKQREALEYFEYALLMELANVSGNVSDGVHVAAAAGVWSSLVFGFGGVSDFDGRLSIVPRLSCDWKELAFSLRFHDRQIRVQLTHDQERYVVDEGAPLEVTIRGEPCVLNSVPHSRSRLRRHDTDATTSL